MQIPQIQKTKEYSIFKSVNFNRDKTKHHIQEIKGIIQKENLLHLHPIIVNESMEVIDGQHRLEAARELEIDIFYIKADVSYEHILNSNLLQRKLSLEDVIKFYAIKDKIPHYIEFQSHMNMLKLSPKSLIALLFGMVSKSLISFIKEGKFQMPPKKDVVENIILSFSKFKDFVQEKRIKPFSMFSCCNFCVAFRNLILITGYNETIFFSKLEQRWFDLKPQLNSNDWTKLLINIYNWKNHNPIINNE